jgi:hypothetical protein
MFKPQQFEQIYYFIGLQQQESFGKMFCCDGQKLDEEKGIFWERLWSVTEIWRMNYWNEGESIMYFKLVIDFQYTCFHIKHYDRHNSNILYVTISTVSICIKTKLNIILCHYDLCFCKKILIRILKHQTKWHENLKLKWNTISII